MNCPDCGAVNPDDARFCGDCGQRVKRAKEPARQEEAKQGSSWDSVFKWIGVSVVVGFGLALLGF
jgi:uncharacterized membrane protein YvbJ